MTIDELYTEVSEAILRAETLVDAGEMTAAREAHLLVSMLEESIADELSVADPEGQIARWGAVNAAMAAELFFRARDLAERYASDPAAPEEFAQQMQTLFAEADARVPKDAEVNPAARFSRAA
jgi:hypothetical protein